MALCGENDCKKMEGERWNERRERERMERKEMESAWKGGEKQRNSVIVCDLVSMIEADTPNHVHAS